MSFLNDYDKEFSEVLKCCKATFNTYPEPFRTIILSQLSMHNPNITKRSSFICYLLPFWLQKTFEIDINICKDVSIANIFGMLYFFIQDDLIDTPQDNTNPEKIFLSNLLFFDFINKYQQKFNYDSPFWKHFNLHIQEWVIANHLEKLEHGGKFAQYTEKDFLILARKVAPLKITYEAMAILSKKEELIEPLGKTIDLILISMQMLDDLGDFKKDIAEGNCTYMLSEVMQYCGLNDFANLTEADVKKAIYFGNVHKKILSLLEKNHNDILSIKLNIDYIKAFSEHLITDCKKVITKIEKNKSIAFEGRFNQLLNKDREV